MENKKNILISIFLLIIVGVAGYFLVSKNSAKIGEEEYKPTLETIEEIAGWKSYKNTVNDFEIKYPPDWEVTGAEDLNDDNQEHVQFPIIANVCHELKIRCVSIEVGYVWLKPSDSRNPKEYEEEKYRNSSSYSNKENREILKELYGKIDGIDTYETITRTKHTVYLVRDGRFYTITYYEDNYFDKQEIKSPADWKYSDMFYPILSTFKFTSSINRTDTHDWKTYVNTEKGFSFSYPSDLVVLERPPRDILLEYEGTQELRIETHSGTTAEALENLKKWLSGFEFMPNENIEINGYPGIKVTTAYNQYVFYLIEAEGKVFVIDFSPFSTKLVSDKILSSFKFTK